MAGLICCALLPEAAQAQPVETALPTISGTPEVGVQLTLTQGQYTDATAVTTTDQWEDCPSGGTCSPISGQTGLTYTPTSSEVGDTIDVVETANATDGTTTETASTGPVTAPPAETALPAISGTAEQGQTLSASTGTWTGTAPITYAYQWESCSGSCSPISGANAATYLPTSTDVGKTIEVEVTATNGDGSATATSGATVTVTGPPTNTALPTISGTAEQGQTLTAATGAWTGTATITYAYQWEACTTTCAAITGATASTYVPVSTEVGDTIEVAVTATNTLGGATATSVATAVVTGPPTNTVLPAITGTAQQGQTLTATTGTWTGTATITYAYQWENCTTSTTCSAITGATAATYSPSSTDVTKTIEVVVTATNTLGSAKATSAATATVVPPAPTNSFPPTISGATTQGSVLTESHGTWTNSPTSYSYEWVRCAATCAAITGATAQTYTLTTADIGATIAVYETATNAGGNSAPAVSALTGTITTPAGIVPVPASSSPPKVSGSTQQGQTLSETHATWSDNPSSYGYQWERCGSSSCSPISGATGQTYTLTTFDVGDTIAVEESATNKGGTSGAVTSARTGVVTATSSTSLVASPTAPDTNQNVTLVSTVSSSSGNAGPSGTVTFYDLYTPINGCTGEAVKSSSQTVTVICQTSFGASRALISAVYRPGAGSVVGGSQSPVTTLSVGKDSTSTSLAVTKQVARNKRATFTATVVLPVSNSGPVEPTGSIEFFDKGRPIAHCVSRPMTQLTATCTVKYAKLGSHSISARYSGDSDFNGSASAPRSVKIVRTSSDAVALGFISSSVFWTFNYHPSYTQIAQLEADGVAPASTIAMTCHGGGCPFAKIKFTGASGASINLLKAFQKHHLRVGSQITVRITRPHFVGKYYLIAIRAGQAPMVSINCLAVGGTIPGVGC